VIAVGTGFALIIVAVVAGAIYQSKKHSEAPPSTTTLGMSSGPKK
jgi:hypothetical protein